jgi:hypothetical protein
MDAAVKYGGYITCVNHREDADAHESSVGVIEIIRIIKGQRKQNILLMTMNTQSKSPECEIPHFNGKLNIEPL